MEIYYTSGPLDWFYEKIANGIGLFYYGDEVEYKRLIGCVIDGDTLGIILETDTEPEQLQNSFMLEQNYPNPFNPSTSISYQIKERGFVNLKIFNTLGQEIATLVNEVKESGSYEIDFDGKNLSSGIYFYQLLVNVPNKIVSNGSQKIFTETKRMMLVK